MDILQKLSRVRLASKAVELDPNLDQHRDVGIIAALNEVGYLIVHLL